MEIEKDVKIEAIRLKAFRLGFSGFGVARPNLGEANVKFNQWLKMGFQGEMGYMKRRKSEREDPRKLLSDTNSVICLSHNYYTTDKDMTFLECKKRGDISLYALNKDYHDVIQPKLNELEKEIKKQFSNSKTKSYVDTGPILEKPLAQKAGLGWIGKHTNLITEGEGSWYFLSEILTTAKLPESNPAIDHCGTCRSCIDICPTNAIVAPYLLDSRRCISYLTIELKGMIPLEFRKAIGNRIYGCDDCQIVCPWNSFAQKTGETDYHEDNETKWLIELMSMDDEKFYKRFRKSPIWRLKRRRFLRNVAIALGNSGDLEALPVLTSSLADKEPLIRAHAVWAIGQLLGKQAFLFLAERLREESEEIVLNEILEIQ